MSEEAKWYVVHTYSGYENKVASSLEKAIENSGLNNMIQSVKVPTEEVTEIKDGKERKIERKVFPGYVFIKMILNDQSWHIVRNVRGCTGFVGSSTEPTPLSEQEIKSLGVEIKTLKLSYNPGDMVKITEGPLQNVTGRITAINAKEKTANVLISMFGRETPAEVSLSQIESLDNAIG